MNCRKEHGHTGALGIGLRNESRDGCELVSAATCTVAGTHSGNAVGPNADIIEVRAGVSTLVDHFLADGYSDVAALDIS